MTFSSLIESLSIMPIMLLVLVLIFITVAWWLQIPRNLPPGPCGFPILGFFPQLMWYMYKGEELHTILTRLGNKYGKIYSFNLFGLVVVVINDFSIMQEGLNDPALNNKGYNNFLQSELMGSHVHSYKHNAELRKFLLTTFRGLGIGKRSFEADILEESEALVDELNTQKEKACSLRHYLANTSANVMSKILFRKRHEYGDKKFNHLLDLNHRRLQLAGAGGWTLLLPYYFPSKDSKETLKLQEDIMASLDKLIEEHREHFDAENPLDFIDIYLKEMDEKPPPEDPNSYLQKRNMKTALNFLFLAGIDTVSTTLEWCCLYMMAHPGIQQKIQEEIDSVVGRNRLPLLSDQSNLPYTRAALLEIQRHVTMLPLLDFHAAGNEILLSGYHVPKGATIVSNAYAVMRDPTAFPEPNQFRPERFIDENGEYFEKSGVIPFGLGRRMCPGENIAKMELFVFFTHLLHRFSLVKPDDVPCVVVEGTYGHTFTPNPFRAVFLPRN
ncbi:cytochrome P450 2U1-like [Amphiura filiformis]|uniref:cytochrome P450 2U1-like n=1 Tax=Amphiura filiformis TaxID=82378 RepID=UPI003B212D1E